MARESTQHKLDRVRPPRVHITYDVEIGDAIEMKELPFVVGVLADLSGKPEEALPRAEGPQVRRDRPRQLQRGAAGHEASPGVPGRQQAQRRRHPDRTSS